MADLPKLPEMPSTPSLSALPVQPAPPPRPTLPGGDDRSGPPAQVPLTRKQHWQKTRSMTAWLLLLWLLTGFCVAFFARELTGLSVFGWPLSFYLAAQGASLVSLAILAFYAWRMRRLDLAANAAPAQPEPRA